MPDTHRILLNGSKMVASFAPYQYGDNLGKGGRIILTDAAVEVEIHGTWEELTRLIDYMKVTNENAKDPFFDGLGIRGELCPWSNRQTPVGAPARGIYTQCPAHPDSASGFVLTRGNSTYVPHKVS